MESYRPRITINAGSIGVMITVVVQIAAMAAGWTVLDEARKTQAEAIFDLRGRVAVLEAERLAAARLEARVEALHATLTRIEQKLDRAEQQPRRR